jgi:AraC-like DNA-binding protein
MCADEDRYRQFMAARAQPPPLTSGDTLHWDSGDAIAPGVALTQGSEPGACAVLPVHRQLATGGQPLPGVPTRPLGLLLSRPVPAIDWARAAASVTFYLEPRLLLPPPVHAMLPGVTGTLLWVHGQGDEESITPVVHPALLVQTASASPQGAHVELVLHVPLDDPLLHHIAAVLQAAVAAEGMADRLYAETLANALADHLLRRYAACRQPARVFSGGLPPSKLQRTTAYIQAHLEHALSLVELAAVAQTSPTHFARLFKQATGQTPHQYVTTCRMECAKQLLTETTLLLHEVGARVGYADQSYFTAMFRQHVGTTPKAYRDATTSHDG